MSLLPPEQMRAIFQQTLDPFANALQDFVRYAMDRPKGPSADSPAVAEIALEHKFAQPGWDMPATNAHTFGYLLAGLLLDHADAYASLRWSATGPVYANATLFRVAMEVAPTAAWLLEPGIGGERRIKRSIVYRIESAIQAKKQDLPTAKASSDKAIKACTEYAEAFKWSHQKLKENGRRAIGGESSPLAHDGAFLDLWSPRSDLAADELRRRAALDAAMWRYASAVAHGTAYAIIESLGSPPPSAAQSTMLNPAMVEKGFVASTDRVQTLGSMMALAAIEVVRRRDVLMGWDAPTEQRDAEERLRNLAVAVAKRKNGRA